VTSQDKLFYDDVNNTRITTDTVDKGDQYDYDGAKRLVTTLRGVPTAYINDPIATNISNTRYDDLVEYVLDQTGNRLTRKIDGSNQRTYAYNTRNALTTEAGTSQGWYDNGTFKGSGSSTTYKYTGDDHFAWYDAGARQFTWHYDALGRQIARTKSGSGGASDIHVYYDGQDDIEVTSWIASTETQLRRMVYGQRANELLEHTDYAGPTSYYAHADKLDSVMLLVEADGDIAEGYRYKEYGEQTVVDNTFAKLTSLNSNVGNWKRYTGQEHALPSSVSDPWYFFVKGAYRADAARFVQRPYQVGHILQLNSDSDLGTMCKTTEAECKKVSENHYEACASFALGDDDGAAGFNVDILCQGVACQECSAAQEGQQIPITFCCTLGCDRDGDVVASVDYRNSSTVVTEGSGGESSGETCAEVGFAWCEDGECSSDFYNFPDSPGATGASMLSGGIIGFVTGSVPGAIAGALLGPTGSALDEILFASGTTEKCCPDH